MTPNPDIDPPDTENDPAAAGGERDPAVEIDSDPDADVDDFEECEAGRYRRYKPTHPLPQPRSLPKDLPIGFQRCGEPFQVGPYGTTITIVVDGEAPCYWDW